jgi:hypothetical protein
LTIKPGVRIVGVRPELLLAIMAASEIYRDLGHKLTLTSVVDGRHSTGSRHYSGAAFDCRTRDLTAEQANQICKQLKSDLGQDFDVLLEADHIHVEYDPKQPLS